MCSTSVILDYGRDRFWPNRDTSSPWPSVLPPISPAISDQTLREFMRLFEEAKRFDSRTGQPNCEDPAKDAVLRRIEERLDTIEKRLEAAADDGEQG